jgi:hypothetical protein
MLETLLGRPVVIFRRVAEHDEQSVVLLGV